MNAMSFWETPKAIAIIIGVAVAVAGTLGGLAGAKFGSQPATTVIQLPPGTTITTPPAKGPTP